MIDDFIETIIPTFSDDEEEFSRQGAKLSMLHVNTKCPCVDTIVVSGKPSSVAFAHLMNPGTVQPIFSGDSTVGSLFQSHGICFVSLNQDFFFDLRAVCDGFKRIVVLDSRQGPADDICALSTDPIKSQLKPVSSGINGMAAYITTNSVIMGDSCSVILNEHRSIRVSLESICSLSFALCQVLNLQNPDVGVLSKEFKKAVPINSRVPLYT